MQVGIYHRDTGTHACFLHRTFYMLHGLAGGVVPYTWSTMFHIDNDHNVHQDYVIKHVEQWYKLDVMG